MSPSLREEGGVGWQGWALEGGMDTGCSWRTFQCRLASRCPQGGHSGGSMRVIVERRALLPLEFHYQQRKSAQGASDRAFPPNTESFLIPRGLPVLSQKPGTQDRRKRKRTKDTLQSHMGSNGTEAASLKNTRIPVGVSGL